MRRKIDLYIDGVRADISDQSLVLFNYAFSDLQEPAAVKNEWSQQITLPGTPANEGIFGHFNRADRRTISGFNAMARTPFVIHTDSGEVLQRGYCRLDEVTTEGERVTGYKVSLFGGLGSFFYGLSYRDDGGKMTLADLSYLNAFDESELDFSITAANVSSAWAKLSETGLSSIWHVLNFAPAYEGIPEGDFDANKAFGSRAGLGLPAQTNYQGTGTNNAYTIVTLAEKVDEWTIHDLRSYLQRPVISMRAILAGIRNWAGYNGFTFDYSDIPASEYNTLWKTLPSIPSLGTFRKSEGEITATLVPVRTTDPVVGSFNLSGVTSYTGLIENASLAFRLWWDTTDYFPTRYLNYGATRASFIFVQVLAYASSTLVGGSDVLVIGPDTCNPTGAAVADGVDYTPAYHTTAYRYMGTQPTQPQTGTYGIPGDLVFNLTATGATRYEIRVTTYRCYGTFTADSCIIMGPVGGDTSVPVLWNAQGVEHTPNDGTNIVAGVADSVVVYSTPQAPRSGAALGKATLLQSKYSPAEYLIGWAKLQGYVFRYDSATSIVYLERRSTFYGTGLDTIDLSERIDRSKGITIAPLNLRAKWYDFGVEVTPGAFAAEYKRIYGRNYGWQRVNTGYEFDSAVQDILAGNPFRAAVSKTAHGPYWFNVGSGIALFISAGHKYTLWSTSDGSPADFDVPALAPTITKTYYNTTHNGYDREGVTRLELADASGKQVDGEDILITFQGTGRYYKYRLTDDTAEMLTANDDRPCWLPYTGAGYALTVPTFSRYAIADGVVTRSLDFGTPQEVDIPDVSFADGSNLYARAWSKYMTDRLDKDTKVLRCRVNLDGIQVGRELLRRFFWYAGSLWVLNKISNYSLTTWDTAECEFVQVQDPTNYTT